MFSTNSFVLAGLKTISHNNNNNSIERYLTFGVGGTFDEFGDLLLQTGQHRRIVPRRRLKLSRSNRDDAVQRGVGPQQPALVNRDRRRVVREQTSVLVDPVAQPTLLVVAGCRRRGADRLPDAVLRAANVVRLACRRQVVVAE